MEARKVLIFSIIFIVMGLVFFSFGLFARSPKQVKKSAFNKIAGNIYAVLGAITFALGLTVLILRNDIPWAAVQVCSVAYLLVVAVISLVFSAFVKTKNEYNLKNSYTKSSGTDGTSQTVES